MKENLLILVVQSENFVSWSHTNISLFCYWVTKNTKEAKMAIHCLVKLLVNHPLPYSRYIITPSYLLIIVITASYLLITVCASLSKIFQSNSIGG